MGREARREEIKGRNASDTPHEKAWGACLRMKLKIQLQSVHAACLEGDEELRVRERFIADKVQSARAIARERAGCVLWAFYGDVCTRGGLAAVLRSE